MKRRRRWLAPVALAAMLAPTWPWAAEPEPVAEQFDASELVRRAAASLGGDRSFISAQLTVSGSLLSRSRELRFQLFEDRLRKRSFLRIREPAKHAGTGYLWLAPVGWSHVPGADVTLRLTREQLAAPWMESDFALADLLRGGWAPQATHRVLAVEASPEAGGGAPLVVIESLAAEGSGATWPRVVTRIESGRGNPVRREYFDAEGELVRVLRLRDVREVSGRYVPHLWEMSRGGEAERLSRIAIETIRFDADFEESVFSTGHLVSGE